MSKYAKLLEEKFDRLYFGNGKEDGKWSVNAPYGDRLCNALHTARYCPNALTPQKAMLLAEIISDYLYLVHDCPTTKLAQEKLACIRAVTQNRG